jgi:hypothetical protein
MDLTYPSNGCKKGNGNPNVLHKIVGGVSPPPTNIQ